MIEGLLIGESLRLGCTLTQELTVTSIARVQASSASTTQPTDWTMIQFQAPLERAEPLAAALAECLAPGGWYVNFTAALDVFVIFPGRVMRYRRGDPAGRAAAVAYGSSTGIPTAQLDWAE